MSRPKSRPMKKIQQEILRTLLVLVVAMTVLLTAVSIFVSVRAERRSLDENLQNMARAVAREQVVQRALAGDGGDAGTVTRLYLDSLQESLSNIDVISVVNAAHVRVYHTNSDLVGTVYDGTMPDFSGSQGACYVASDTGPSGSQRRAYAAVYDANGRYLGFVLAVLLNQNINRMILNTAAIHFACAAVVILLAVALSRQLSGRIKSLLRGYEPDVFSAMFSLRENTLEALEEGIVAADADGCVVYMNGAARRMLHAQDIARCRVDELVPALSMERTLRNGEKETGISLHPAHGAEILADLIPVAEQGRTVGALCILRDRTEYTKMMEDLSGVRYMVESMRANNHDFTNKLHVILGLIQMGKTDEAAEYIAHITTVQQNVVQNVVKNIVDPSVAALLIGKYARASELNIQFKIKSGSHLSRSDISIPSCDLVTILGNLLDNAMDAMNEKAEQPKELTAGLYSQPGALLLCVEDTGPGIEPERQRAIFENGYSTKGDGRGTGLYVVSTLVHRYGGTISVESEPGYGTSFTVTLTGEGEKKHV